MLDDLVRSWWLVSLLRARPQGNREWREWRFLFLYKEKSRNLVSAFNPQGPALGRCSSQCHPFVAFLPLQQSVMPPTLLLPPAFAVAGALRRQRRLAGEFSPTLLGGRSLTASVAPMLPTLTVSPSMKTALVVAPPSMPAFNTHWILCSCLGSQLPQKKLQRYSQRNLLEN